MQDSKDREREQFVEQHTPFPAALDTLSLLAEMQRRMERAGVESFTQTIDAARQELDKMPEARARALGPSFWTKRLVLTANRALREVGKSERWTQVKLQGDRETAFPMWLLVTQAEGKALETLGLGRRVRPGLRFASLPFLLGAIALGILAYRRQTTGSIVLAFAAYLAWFAASQVAARLSSGRSWRSL
jgi:hypothetical protein